LREDHDNVEVRTFPDLLLSAELISSVRREIALCRDGPGCPQLRVSLSIENSTAEECRSGPTGPPALETGQSVALEGVGSSSGPEAQPICELREMAKRVIEEGKGCAQFITALAVCSKVIVSHSSLEVPEYHANGLTPVNCAEQDRTGYTQLFGERGWRERRHAADVVARDQVAVEENPVLCVGVRFSAYVDFHLARRFSNIAPVVGRYESVRRRAKVRHEVLLERRAHVREGRL
jgi:hypothetical protein